MKQKTRNTLTVLLLLAVAAASWATGEWWLVWASLAALAGGSFFQLIRRYYVVAQSRHRRILVLANQLFALALLVFYLWLAANEGPASVTAWMIWALVLAPPILLLWLGVVAWRRIEA